MDSGDSQKFKNINPRELAGNVFELIGGKWMLVTPTVMGKSPDFETSSNGFNTMTASWGGMGIMWGKPVASCVIRPVRYTYEFMEAADYFTLSFFPEEYKKALNILGTKSGRDTDKVKESGLNPALFALDNWEEDVNKQAFAFMEAEIILICRKIYYQDIDPANFINQDLDKNYPNKDYHRMYFGEIIQAFIK